MSALDDNLNVPALALLAKYAQESAQPLKKTASINDTDSFQAWYDSQFGKAATERLRRASLTNASWAGDVNNTRNLLEGRHKTKAFNELADFVLQTAADPTRAKRLIEESGGYEKALQKFTSALSYLKANKEAQRYLTDRGMSIQELLTARQFSGEELAGSEWGKKRNLPGHIKYFYEQARDIANAGVDPIKDPTAFQDVVYGAVSEDGKTVPAVKEEINVELRQAQEAAQSPEEATAIRDTGAAVLGVNPEEIDVNRGLGDGLVTESAEKVVQAFQDRGANVSDKEVRDKFKRSFNAIQELKRGLSVPEVYRQAEISTKNAFAPRMGLNDDQREEWLSESVFGSDSDGSGTSDVLDETEQKELDNILAEDDPSHIRGYGRGLNYSQTGDRDRPWAGGASGSQYLSDDKLQSISDKYAVSWTKEASKNKDRNRLEDTAEAEAEQIVGNYGKLAQDLDTAKERKAKIDDYIDKLEEAGIEDERLTGLKGIKVSWDNKVKSLTGQKQSAERWMTEVGVNPAEVEAAVANGGDVLDDLVNTAKNSRAEQLAQQYNNAVPDWKGQITPDEDVKAEEPNWAGRANTVRNLYDTVTAMEDKYGSRQQMGVTARNDYDSKLTTLKRWAGSLNEDEGGTQALRNELGDNFKDFSRVTGGDYTSGQALPRPKSDMEIQRDIVNTTSVGMDGKLNVGLQQKVQARRAKLNEERRKQNADNFTRDLNSMRAERADYYTPDKMRERDKASAAGNAKRPNNLSSAPSVQNPATAQHRAVNRTVADRRQAADRVQRPDINRLLNNVDKQTTNHAALRLDR